MADVEPRTIELLGVFAQLLGAWYPKDYVVAAIDGTQGETAKQALVSAGWGSNAASLYESARVLQIGTAIYEQRSPLQRAGAAVARAVTDEGLMAQEYVDEAKRGASIIAVRCSEPRLVDQARKVLKAHGARRIRYYGATVITDLS